MSDFFSIYSSIGRRGSFMTEAALSVDSNRDVTSRGNTHTDKTMSPDLRDKVLHARVQEIEAFAKDRGIDPVVVMGAAEASLRSGRVPNLTMYGMHGDNMVALKHFIAGEILNLAGMEAINWDGTPIEEAEQLPELDAEQKGARGDHFRRAAEKLAKFVQKKSGDRTLGTAARKRIMSILGGDQEHAGSALDYQIHTALNSDDGQSLTSKNMVFDALDPEHRAVLNPHINKALNHLDHFVRSAHQKKPDDNKPQSAGGIPAKPVNPNDHKRGNSQGGGPKPVYKQTDDITPNGELQQEFAADRSASGTNWTGGVRNTSTTPTDPTKPMIQGYFSKQNVSDIEKGQRTIKGQTKGGQAAHLDGQTNKQMRAVGRELGVLGTENMDNSNELLNMDGPDDPRLDSWPKMADSLKRLLNIESRGLYHSPNLSEAGSVWLPPTHIGGHSAGATRDIERKHPPMPQIAGAGAGGQPPKPPKAPPAAAPVPNPHFPPKKPGSAITAGHAVLETTTDDIITDMLAVIDEAGAVGGSSPRRKSGRRARPGRTTRLDDPKDTAYKTNAFVDQFPVEHRNVIRRVINDRTKPIGQHVHEFMPKASESAKLKMKLDVEKTIADWAAKRHDDVEMTGDLQQESTTTGAVGHIMSMVAPPMARPNTIASFDASVDLNTDFHPARLGMTSVKPVRPFAEARRYRGEKGAAEFIANRKLAGDLHAGRVAIHKGDDGSFHVQIRGAKGRDGTSPTADQETDDKNEGGEGKKTTGPFTQARKVKFTELTKDERGRFAKQPAETKYWTARTTKGVQMGDDKKPIASSAPAEAPKRGALSVLRGALAKITGRA